MFILVDFHVSNMFTVITKKREREREENVEEMKTFLYVGGRRLVTGS